MGFHRVGSRLVAALGEPRHRGVDLIATDRLEAQVVEGDVAYGALDQALENEQVDVFACDAQRWRLIARTHTDGEGHFSVALTGATRLPLGLHGLYASVVGDRSGVGFLAYVAPVNTSLVVSDVDGTLTESENAVVRTLLTGKSAGIETGAPAAFRELERRGYQPVYLTARGRAFTEVTRRWLAANGMPRGPIIHATALVSLPGAASLRHKSSALAALRASGFSVAIGIGNRATDVAAYASIGVPPDHVWIMLPELRAEVSPAIARGRATGFETYDQLRTNEITRLAASAASTPDHDGH